MSAGKGKKVYWFLFSYSGVVASGAISLSLPTKFVTKANIIEVQEYLEKSQGDRVIVTGFSYMGSALDTDKDVTGE
jgi:hypothetical protein